MVLHLVGTKDTATAHTTLSHLLVFYTYRAKIQQREITRDLYELDSGGATGLEAWENGYGDEKLDSIVLNDNKNPPACLYPR